MLFALACAAFCATMIGGLIALRLKDKRHLVLGFSAGAVIGVAFFDLLPEAFNLRRDFEAPDKTALWAGLGFLLYLILDRLVLFISRDASDYGRGIELVAARGALGALSLTAHSFLDGVAIGFAFQVSNAVGLIVAMAVLTHDFSDGINTMNVVLKNGGMRDRALRWLAADALAPAVGIASTYLYTLPQHVFGNVLALFAGFFLYIGASDLIPESYHAHPKFLTTLMTLIGAATIYLAVCVADL